MIPPLGLNQEKFKVQSFLRSFYPLWHLLKNTYIISNCQLGINSIINQPLNKNKGHISVMNQKICPASYKNLHLNRGLFDFLRRSPNFGLYNFYDILLITPLIKVCKITNMVLLSFLTHLLLFRIVFICDNIFTFVVVFNFAIIIIIQDFFKIKLVLSL